LAESLVVLLEAELRLCFEVDEFEVLLELEAFERLVGVHPARLVQFRGLGGWAELGQQLFQISSQCLVEHLLDRSRGLHVQLLADVLLLRVALLLRDALENCLKVDAEELTLQLDEAVDVEELLGKHVLVSELELVGVLFLVEGRREGLKLNER